MRTKIRCEDYIRYFLDYFSISKDNYSLGEILNNKICVIDQDNGYLVFTVTNNEALDKVYVDNFFDVVRLVYQKDMIKNTKKLIK